MCIRDRHQIDRFLDLAGIPYILIPGKEADDLMAVVARRAEKAGWEVIIVSSDKDLLQLVSDRIRLAKPGKKAEAMGPEDVEALTGVQKLVLHGSRFFKNYWLRRRNDIVG